MLIDDAALIEVARLLFIGCS